MQSRILQTVKKYNMLNNGDTVIVGLSGGADSVCLLHFLCSIKEQYNIKIIAAHINHNLRGQEAARDESFADKLCRSLNVPFELLSADIRGEAKKSRESTELYARKVRYGFFEELSKKYGGAKIATAHTASDNAETVLFNLARGASVAGLCGIPPVRDNIIIRPLIEITRDQVELYCEQNCLKFVIDSTNLTDEYTRNKIRHNVIPALKEINPSLESAVLRLCENAAENKAYLKKQAQKLLQESLIKKNIYSADILSQQDNAVLKQAVSLILTANEVKAADSTHIHKITEIIKKNGGALDLPCDKRAVVKQGMFRVISCQSCVNNVKISLKEANGVTQFNKYLTLKTVPLSEFKQIVNNDKKVLKNSLDYDIIKNNSFFRSRKSGDVFSLPGRGISKTVKKLFNEMKIPQEERDKILILADENAVYWIESVGVSVLARVTNKTRNVLIINIADKDD